MMTEETPEDENAAVMAQEELSGVDIDGCMLDEEEQRKRCVKFYTVVIQDDSSYDWNLLCYYRYYCCEIYGRIALIYRVFYG